MKYFIADVFTETKFGGNPAGVVLVDEGRDFPDVEMMKKAAAELRYSETVFVKKLDASTFHLRFFTVEDEIELCGHATIGAFALMARKGFIKRNGVYTAKTLSGDLEIKLQEGFVMMEVGQPRVLRRIEMKEETLELYKVMGLDYQPPLVQCSCTEYMRLIPLVITTGLADIIMPVVDRRALDAVKPDFEALRKLSKQYAVCGVHVFTYERDYSKPGITAHCRNFSPLCGINEEAATGTSCASLTYYLYGCDLVHDGSECQFIQGEAMGRPSVIFSHIKALDAQGLPEGAPAPVKIQVGGAAVIIAEGDIWI